MLGSAEIRKVALISREIIFEEFQPMWSQYYVSVTDRQTDGGTDEQLASAIPRSVQHRAVKTATEDRAVNMGALKMMDMKLQDMKSQDIKVQDKKLAQKRQTFEAE